MSRMVDVALQISSELGFPVFPCREYIDKKKNKVSKAPYTSRGFKDASTDENQIREWWSKFPNALVGVPTGEVTDIFVVDIDTDGKKDGQSSFDKLEVGDPETCQTITLSGGRHLIFKYPADLPVTIDAGRLLGDGVDIRSDGGYVIWAGSASAHGCYEYRAGYSPIEVGFRPMSDKLIGHFLQAIEEKKAKVTKQNPLVGERNNTLFNEAVTLSNKGVSKDLIAEYLRDRNLDCVEPIDIIELNTICENATSYKESANLALTDLGNAERFARDHQGEVIFCSDQEAWYAWNGTIWESGEIAIQQRAKQTTRNMLAEKMPNDEVQQQLKKWQKQSESAARQAAILSTARSHEKLVLTSDALDKNKSLFNVANGTLDLERSTLKPHTNTDLLTKVANASLLDNETAPRWKTFIEEVTVGDRELASFLQKACGYLLCGDRKEQIILFLIGEGANGKSVFIDVISHVFGDYAGVISAKALIDKSAGSIPSDIAAIASKRLVTLSEFPERVPINTTTVKSITGGDKLTARHLYQKWFKFTPQFQLLCAMNDLPQVHYADDAYFRRIRILPFNRRFTEAEMDKDLATKLKSEADGILGWCLEGYKLYRSQGLKQTQRMTVELEHYRRNADPVSQFVNDCIEMSSSDVFTTRDDLVKEVTEYCISEELDCPRGADIKKRLTRYLGEATQKRIGNNRVRGYEGLRVLKPIDNDYPF